MRQITIPAVAQRIVEEDVTSITIDSSMRNITLILSTYEAGERISHRSVSLGNAGYEMLMETFSPAWASGKPMGSFRKEDIYSAMAELGIE